MSELLRLEGVTVTRGGRRLFAPLDWRLRAGRIAVVLGPNGVGKSSLLLALAGLLPAGGRLLLDGRPLTAHARRELASRIAWQGELPPVDFGLTVRQRLALAGDGIDDAAGEMDVAHLLDRPLGALSAGERQRVELAAVLLRGAPLWLLDEPTAHLDLRHQARCLDMLRRAREGGRGIVVVLHDLAQAEAVADDAILIGADGSAAAGPADAMLEAGRLSALYEARLARKPCLVPDYLIGRS